MLSLFDARTHGPPSKPAPVIRLIDALQSAIAACAVVVVRRQLKGPPSDGHQIDSFDSAQCRMVLRFEETTAPRDVRLSVGGRALYNSIDLTIGF
jgi:hypothetical protein